MNPRPRRPAARVAALALALVALLATGCKDRAPSPDSVRRLIERGIPGSELRPDSRIHLGRFTLAVAKGVMRLVAFEDRETRRALSHIHRVDIAEYEVVTLPTAGLDALAESFAGKLDRHGWYPMVTSREEDSRTWIFYRENDAGSISNLYIVELDATELVVIDLAGRLDRLTADLIADDPSGFMADLGS